jgi:hypothetical protein
MKFQIQKYLQKNINKEKFNSDDSNDDGVLSEKQQEYKVLEEKVEEKDDNDSITGRNNPNRLKIRHPILV